MSDSTTPPAPPDTSAGDGSLPLAFEPLERAHINTAIHEMMGYRRVPHDPKHYQTPHGYAWKSPSGMLYEGHMGMVPDYLAKLTEAAKIIKAIASALEANKPLDTPPRP
jgi:hypothetical protein